MPETLVQIGRRARNGSPAPPPRREPRPEWLRIRLRTPEKYQEVKRLVAGLSLNTVCTEARCPNIYECWGEHGTATFMILGDTCTRRCGFCSVHSGRPAPGVDAGEPERVAEAVETMGLKHAVVTSVDRDDLPDGGAGHFRATIEAIHRRVPGCAVEVLTPDFRGVEDALDIVLGAGSSEPVHPDAGAGAGAEGPEPPAAAPIGPEVFSHNVETVPRLYRSARPGSRYERSLELLAEASRRRDAGRYRGRTKTAIMLGLGEDDDEVRATMRDIRDSGVQVLAMGQYLQPTRGHLPVERYVSPAEFARFREYALDLGFLHCEAGPLVRSSYHAHEHVGSSHHGSLDHPSNPPTPSSPSR